MSDFTTRIVRKNKNNETDLPLTISSKDGLVDQVSFFNKTVASKDMSGYYLIRNGEFAYNKSYSVGYNFGSIKRLDRYPMGALSTLYICFELNKHNSDFIKTYFDSLKWYKEIYLISAEGARNHGLLNIPTEDFFDSLHYIPSGIEEQEKIADFLMLIDQKVQKQQQLVELLKKYKKGIIDHIFSQKYSFGKDEWRESKLGEICSYRRGSFPQPYGLPEWYDDVNGMPFIQVADVDDNFNIKDITKRKISKIAEKQSVYVPQGSLIITLQGTIGRVAITHYDAFVDRTLLIISNISTAILPEYLMYACYLKFNYEKQTADGSIIKTITKETLTDFIITYPSLEMQKKIVDYLMKIENYLLHETQIYDNLLQQKRGLLQQLFI